VEASPLVDVLKEIIELNDEEKVIEVIHGKAEEIDLENGIKVDIIISEWMGFYLLHESIVWFDVTFDPIIYDEEYEEPFAKVELKTGPCDPETHWKQTILVVPGNMAGKCALMKALLEKEDKEMQDLEEI
jgi:hypothetical protein